MHWITTQTGELVNLANCTVIRVRSTTSISGKHEVVTWDPMGEDLILFRSLERGDAIQFVRDLFFNMTSARSSTGGETNGPVASPDSGR